MPTKKKAAKKATRSRSSSRATLATSEAMAAETTTDTKTIVVVLLLLFVYPIGVVFMWIWMKTWPTWLKIIITIPFIFGILSIILGFTVAGWFVRNSWREERPMYRMEQHAPQITNDQFSISPTPQQY